MIALPNYTMDSIHERNRGARTFIDKLEMSLFCGNLLPSLFCGDPVIKMRVVSADSCSSALLPPTACEICSLSRDLVSLEVGSEAFVRIQPTVSDQSFARLRHWYAFKLAAAGYE